MFVFQRHSISGSMSAAKPLSSLSDKRASYTDITMPGEAALMGINEDEKSVT